MTIIESISEGRNQPKDIPRALAICLRLSYIGGDEAARCDRSLHPRGLIDPNGSCSWIGPWAFPNGAHLRCRFPGIDFSIARGGFVALPTLRHAGPPLIDRPPPKAPATTLLSSKAALRAQALGRRDALSTSERTTAASSLAAFADALDLAPGTKVAAYVAIRSEMDPTPLVARLSDRGVQFCLPVVEADRQTMHFRVWTPGEPLQPSEFGLSVPADTAAIVEPEVLLMPLAAFDGAGHRIGWGKGHYDRALERLETGRRRRKIGLAFSVQRVDAIPFEPHDRPLDMILTETGPIRPSSTTTDEASSNSRGDDRT